MCLSLPPPDNGMITYGPDMTEPFNYQTTASYACNSGFELSGGDSNRQCIMISDQNSEGWSGTAPTCVESE